jgi:hypothetical protein
MTFLTKSDGDLYKLWASIRPEHLTINSEDMTMKYGSVMDGLWHVVGIVDANLGKPNDPHPVNPMIDGAITALAAIREQVGRPQDHFGLTPIAIYSPIKGFIEDEIRTDAAGVAESE